MARREVLVQLSDELIATLDALAAREGVSRSEIVRRGLAQAYRVELDAEIDRLIVEGYTRFPPGRIDEWGDLSAQTTRFFEETGRRLDEEDGGWPAEQPE